MTSPLSPEAVAQMVADREAGTPGPWTDRNEDIEDADDYSVERSEDDYDGLCYSTVGEVCGRTVALVVVPSSLGMNDIQAANSRRIARIPDIEDTCITLVAENAALRAEQAMLKFDIDKMLTQIEGHNAAWDELRASEAAAVARVKVLTEAGNILAANASRFHSALWSDAIKPTEGN